MADSRREGGRRAPKGVFNSFGKFCGLIWRSPKPKEKPHGYSARADHVYTFNVYTFNVSLLFVICYYKYRKFRCQEQIYAQEGQNSARSQPAYSEGGVKTQRKFRCYPAQTSKHRPLRLPQIAKIAPKSLRNRSEKKISRNRSCTRNCAVTLSMCGMVRILQGNQDVDATF